MTPLLTGLTFDGIVRVSKTGEREYLRAPDQQKADLYRWAKSTGNEIGKVHVAIDESAGKGSHPAIEAAKARALAGDVDGVVAPYLSRFSRNTVYGLETVEQLLEAGRYFVSLDCPFDLSTPEGEKYLTDKLAEARYEWRVRRDNFTRAVKEAVENGVHIGAPYGYQRSDGPGTKLAALLSESPAVLMMAELRAEGHSWPAIAAALNKTEYRPRPYKRDRVERQAVWTHKTVRQIVRNRVYTGVAFNGDHETENAHDVIVPLELWERANRTKGTKPQRHADGYLLTGLVRCAACGYAMTHRGDGARRAYYSCTSGQHGAGRCPEPANVPAQDLEDFVAERFREQYLKPDHARVPSEVDSEIAAAEAAVSDAKRRLRGSFAAKRELGDQCTPTEREIADDQIEADRAALREAEARLRSTRADVRGAIDLPAWLDQAAWDSADVQERRHWLSLVYACVVVRKAIRWREPAKDRATLIPADDAPRESTHLIGYIVALNS